MADMITRCPKCGTAFRISDALLKSAKGVVRCGSCLSVFNAKEHLETKPTSTPAPVPVKPNTPPPKPTPVPERTDDDDLTEELSPWRTRQPEARQVEESLFERSRSTMQEDEDTEEDEAWALELLKDDSDLNIRFKKVSDKPAPSTPSSSHQISSNPQPSSYSSRTTYESPLESVAAPESSDEEAVLPLPEREVNEPEPAPSLAAPAAALAAIAPPGVASHPATSSVTSPTVASPTAAATPASPSKAAPSEVDETPATGPKRKPIRPKFEPKSVPLEQVIAALEPEPLELDWQQPGSWKKRLLWPLLVLVALLALLIQVAWLEFHKLNRLEPYRSFYGIACQVVGCVLPELRDLTLIQTSNLVVRASPELDGVLQVDVILQNNASFEQAFPNIQLTFTNMNNAPVATRTLQPGDYLGGELAGRDKMPVRQPIHIGLEIADPGRDAVSYHISIVE